MLDWLKMLKIILNIQANEILIARVYLVKTVSLFVRLNQF